MDDMNTKKLFDLFAQGKAGDERSKETFLEYLRQLYLPKAVYALTERRPFKHQEELKKDAQELVQKFLEVVWKKWEEAASKENECFVRWANGVLRNLIRNYVRSEISRNKVFSHDNDFSIEFPDPDSPNDDPLGYKELLDRLPAMIKRLSDICQTVIKIFLQGGGAKEVLAAFPGEPRGRIDKRIFDCRKNFKKIIKEEGFEL